MKKIIVDTNIIFSALLNSNGIIGDLIFNLTWSLSFTIVIICGMNQETLDETQKDFKTSGRTANGCV
ncbi:MAG: hypothetical protein ACR2KZ_19745 [Segetibacter sp.]